jgi:hypothetical protein
MPPTRAELEFHCGECYSLTDKAQQAINRHGYSEGMRLAVNALLHVDGMMQYERKYECRSIDRVRCIDIILQYAPLLLDADSLDKLAEVLKSQKRIDKNAEADLAKDLELSRAQLRIAHQLWDQLETHPVVTQEQLEQATRTTASNVGAVIHGWQQMGAVIASANGNIRQYSLTTRMGDAVPTKCISCGATGKAPKMNLLDEITCPRCRSSSFFLILA